jgi:preprotein translocase subunit SecD
VNRGNVIRLAIIVILFGLALSEVLIRDAPSIGGGGPGNNTLGMRLGLDLSGGTHLVYKADLSQIGNETAADAVEGAMDIIELRVNAHGVSEPVIQKQGGDRISVQLPGIRDMDAAVELIGQTGELDFRELIPESWQLIQTSIAQGNFTSYESFTERGIIEWIPATAIDSRGEEVHLTGKHLERNTYVDFKEITGEPIVLFELTSEGADLFAEITGRLIGRPLGIFLDDAYYSSPIVQSRIEGGSGVIENVGSRDEAHRLTRLLNYGALPVPLGEPIIREDIDPTLGADSIRKSLIAGVVGLVLVLAFMMLYYRLPGVLASGALLLYGVLVLAAFKLIPVTLTLAGIAAFILSVGMAVDANVLIFERLKEELRAGRTLGGAIEAGFNRAWVAIRDSNISTLITCLILWLMGRALAEPRVMGFALTLAIGIALSMFTAIFVTRTFLRLFVGTRLASRLSLFGMAQVEQTSLSKEQE